MSVHIPSTCEIDLLNHFAGNALIGLVGKPGVPDSEAARRSYDIAWRMLERSRRITEDAERARTDDG
jgi:hypothetical protein